MFLWTFTVAILVWLWDAARWAPLRILDVGIWLILSLTENGRALRRTSFTKDERNAIARSQGRKCIYCGVRLTVKNLQIDHMDPVSRGGSNDYDNLQALCRRCNARKGKHTDREFRERYRELVGDYRYPPDQRIPQRYFDEITRSTQAHEGVREANRSRTPHQRVVNALPVTFLWWVAVFSVVSVLWFNSVFTWYLVAGCVFGIAFAAGIYFRAAYIGIFD